MMETPAQGLQKNYLLATPAWQSSSIPTLLLKIVAVGVVSYGHRKRKIN
jgi:hypothetical protein